MKKHIRTIGSVFASVTTRHPATTTPLARLIACSLPALAGGLWLMSAQPVAAYPSAANAQASVGDSAYDALREFAREVGIKSAGQPAVASSQDDAYSALLDFAQMVGADAPKTVAGEAATNPAPAAKPAAKPKPAAVKSSKPVFKENKGGQGDAYFVGSAKCMTCHAAVAAEFATTLMGRIGKTTRKGTMECENCHGPGSKHVAAGGGRGVGGMMSFRPDDPRYSVQEINETCLNCHEKGERTAWKGSTHETRGLACTNCHTVMRNVTPKNSLASAVEAQVCFQCHKLQRAQMQRSSHMPVREGKITCSNCHSPHGSVNGTEAMIREASINDNCYKCHAEKRGPMLWEHAPVRENCLNCHEAHGSNHEYLLKVQRPRLCAECHAFAHGGQGSQGARVSTNYTVGHSCNNCHTQIHGSNSPSGSFFQR